MSLIKLLLAEIFGAKKAKLDGANLFSNEFYAASQYMSIVNMFGKTIKAIVRIPVQGNTVQQFLNASRMANQAGIEVLALLDSYESDSSMMSRLTTIKNSASYVKYVQLFNELPKMNDLYPGKKITSLQDLLEKTNRYADWVHHNIGGAKVVTEATYNLMDSRSDGWNVTNTEITKQLILYTVADIVAVHLYGDSFGKKLELANVSTSIDKWNKEASGKGYPKKIFVTECGEDNWGGQVNYYDKIVKLIGNLLSPEKIIWYRQAVKNQNDGDNGYALEIINGGQKSPLYNKLIG